MLTLTSGEMIVLTDLGTISRVVDHDYSGVGFLSDEILP